jgi:peptide/nickel transport system substrate-binding protein
MYLRFALRTALAAGIAFLVAGCGSQQEPEPEVPAGPVRGGVAVMGSLTDVDSWNEYLARQAIAGHVLRRIYLRLAQEQGDGLNGPRAYAPLLAESWSFSKDELALTFRLRQAVWSDGKPISAHDVRFTWLAQTSPDVPWQGAGSKGRITDVVVESERTVVFRFDRVYADQFADAVEGGIVPEHVFGKVPFGEWTSHDWSRESIGSGPFILERHEPANEFVLVRNPRYYGNGPLLERVVFRIQPDITGLVTQLRAGELDYLENVPPRDATRFAEDPAFTVVPFDYRAFDFIGWNAARPPLDDPALRRALTLAIDRQALVDELLYGYGVVSRGPVVSFSWAADPDLTPWPYDPDAARKVLRDRGFATTDADGTRTPGTPLSLEVTTDAGNRLRQDALVKIQEQLSRVGVELEIRALEAGAVRSAVGSGEFDGFLAAFTFSLRDLGALFASESVPPGGFNFVHYRSDEVDRALDAASAATDWESMRQPLYDVQRGIHGGQPYTFLFERKRIAVYNRRLGGVEIDLPNDPLVRLEEYWVRGD